MNTRQAGAPDLYGDAYPESWYAVAQSSSLPKGRVRELEAFGEKLVLYRTASGEPRIAQRFCPHMGASLAHGRVEGERLSCPFHHWCFDGNGRCASIPYLPEHRIPARAQIRTWPVLEHLGWLWVYNGATPAYTLPDFPEHHDQAYGRCFKSQQFDIHPLLILENGCDPQHFKYVHGNDFLRYDVVMTKSGPHELGFDVEQELRVGKGTIRLTTSICYVGASAIFGGCAFEGKPLFRFIAAPLPLGHRRTLFHLLVYPRRLPWWAAPVNPIYEAILANKVFRGSTDDYVPIWKDMDTDFRSVLVADDALQQRFRKYYRAHLPRPTLVPLSVSDGMSPGGDELSWATARNPNPASPA
jgi:nitrite reductase/ring-hydroxylating ferredoxin subunit